MAEPLVWVDGSIVSESDFRVSPFDESILYGRGIFETTRTVNKRPWLWDEHRERAVVSANEIGITITIEDLPTIDDVTHFVEKSRADLVIRMTVAASSPGAWRVWMVTRPLASSSTAARLTVAAQRISPTDRLASLKTLNYLGRHLAFEAAREAGYDDAILLSTEGDVLETAHSNLFIRKSDAWFTPALTGGILPGTVRSLILREAPPGTVQERVISVEELSDCDEAILTNSVRGAVSVGSINGRELSTTKHSEWMQEIVNRSQRAVSDC